MRARRLSTLPPLLRCHERLRSALAVRQPPSLRRWLEPAVPNRLPPLCRYFSSGSNSSREGDEGRCSLPPPPPPLPNVKPVPSPEALAGKRAATAAAKPGFRDSAYAVTHRLSRRARIFMVKDRVAVLRWKNCEKCSFSYSFSCLSGHISFILLAGSYGFSDIWHLRSMAIAAGVAMLGFNYYHPNGKPLWLPFKWNLLFILTNSLHLLYLLSEEKKAEHMPMVLQHIYEEVFEPTGLSRVDFFKLTRAGKVLRMKPGQNLCYEGAVNCNVMVICSGKADVVVRGVKIYELTVGQFIGEMGIHVGLRVPDAMRASATVTATEEMNVLVWPRGTLIDILEHDEGIARAVQSAISADLVRKLSREDLDANRIHVKAEHLYHILLESVLNSGRVTHHDRNILRRYRIVHRIPDSSHESALKKHAWSVEEYESGERLKPSPSELPSESSEEEERNERYATQISHQHF